MTDATTGTGLDLGIMRGSHDAFRRDLEPLARVASRCAEDPARAASVAAVFPWILDGAADERVAALLGGLPPFAAERYRREWKPAYDGVQRW